MPGHKLQHSTNSGRYTLVPEEVKAKVAAQLALELGGGAPQGRAFPTERASKGQVSAAGTATRTRRHNASARSAARDERCQGGANPTRKAATKKVKMVPQHPPISLKHPYPTFTVGTMAAAPRRAKSSSAQTESELISSLVHQYRQPAVYPQHTAPPFMAPQPRGSTVDPSTLQMLQVVDLPPLPHDVADERLCKLRQQAADLLTRVQMLLRPGVGAAYGAPGPGAVGRASDAMAAHPRQSAAPQDPMGEARYHGAGPSLDAGSGRAKAPLSPQEPPAVLPPPPEPSSLRAHLGYPEDPYVRLQHLVQELRTYSPSSTTFVEPDPLPAPYELALAAWDPHGRTGPNPNDPAVLRSPAAAVKRSPALRTMSPQSAVSAASTWSVSTEEIERRLETLKEQLDHEQRRHKQLEDQRRGRDAGAAASSRYPGGRDQEEGPLHDMVAQVQSQIRSQQHELQQLNAQVNALYPSPNGNAAPAHPVPDAAASRPLAPTDLPATPPRPMRHPPPPQGPHGPGPDAAAVHYASTTADPLPLYAMATALSHAEGAAHPEGNLLQGSPPPPLRGNARDRPEHRTGRVPDPAPSASGSDVSGAHGAPSAPGVHGFDRVLADTSQTSSSSSHLCSCSESATDASQDARHTRCFQPLSSADHAWPARAAPGAPDLEGPGPQRPWRISLSDTPASESAISLLATHLFRGDEAYHRRHSPSASSRGSSASRHSSAGRRRPRRPDMVDVATDPPTPTLRPDASRERTLLGLGLAPAPHAPPDAFAAKPPPGFGAAPGPAPRAADPSAEPLRPRCLALDYPVEGAASAATDHSLMSIESADDPAALAASSALDRGGGARAGDLRGHALPPGADLSAASPSATGLPGLTASDLQSSGRPAGLTASDLRSSRASGAPSAAPGGAPAPAPAYGTRGGGRASGAAEDVPSVHSSASSLLGLADQGPRGDGTGSDLSCPHEGHSALSEASESEASDPAGPSPGFAAVPHRAARDSPPSPARPGVDSADLSPSDSEAETSAEAEAQFSTEDSTAAAEAEALAEWGGGTGARAQALAQARAEEAARAEAEAEARAKAEAEARAEAEAQARAEAEAEAQARAEAEAQAEARAEAEAQAEARAEAEAQAEAEAEAQAEAEARAQAEAEARAQAEAEARAQAEAEARAQAEAEARAQAEAEARAQAEAEARAQAEAEARAQAEAEARAQAEAEARAQAEAEARAQAEAEARAQAEAEARAQAEAEARAQAEAEARAQAEAEAEALAAAEAQARAEAESKMASSAADSPEADSEEEQYSDTFSEVVEEEGLQEDAASDLRAMESASSASGNSGMSDAADTATPRNEGIVSVAADGEAAEPASASPLPREGGSSSAEHCPEAPNGGQYHPPLAAVLGPTEASAGPPMAPAGQSQRPTDVAVDIVEKMRQQRQQEAEQHARHMAFLQQRVQEQVEAEKAEERQAELWAAEHARPEADAAPAAPQAPRAHIEHAFDDDDFVAESGSEDGSHRRLHAPSSASSAADAPGGSAPAVEDDIFAQLRRQAARPGPRAAPRISRKDRATVSQITQHIGRFVSRAPVPPETMEALERLVCARGPISEEGATYLELSDNESGDGLSTPPQLQRSDSGSGPEDRILVDDAEDDWIQPSDDDSSDGGGGPGVGPPGGSGGAAPAAPPPPSSPPPSRGSGRGGGAPPHLCSQALGLGPLASPPMSPSRGAAATTPPTSPFLSRSEPVALTPPPSLSPKAAVRPDVDFCPSPTAAHPPPPLGAAPADGAPSPHKPAASPSAGSDASPAPTSPLGAPPLDTSMEELEDDSGSVSSAAASALADDGKQLEMEAAVVYVSVLFEALRKKCEAGELQVEGTDGVVLPADLAGAVEDMLNDRTEDDDSLNSAMSFCYSQAFELINKPLVLDCVREAAAEFTTAKTVPLCLPTTEYWKRRQQRREERDRLRSALPAEAARSEDLLTLAELEGFVRGRVRRWMAPAPCGGEELHWTQVAEEAPLQWDMKRECGLADVVDSLSDFFFEVLLTDTAQHFSQMA